MTKPARIPEAIGTLGEAIRFLRAARGFTLRELARRVGVSAPFLSDVERNRRATDRLAEISKALEVPVADLQRYDARLPADLKAWISSGPGVPSLLRDLRDSGMDAYQLRSALLKKKR